MPSECPRTFEISPEDAGQRLDVFLSGRLQASRSQVRKLLERGAVLMNGVLQGSSDKGVPVPGEGRVEVSGYRPPQDQRALAEPGAPLRVLARGPGWLALDKPAGLPVHPFVDGDTGTLMNAVAARHPEIFGVGEGGLRSGVVHRLDVDTSGVVLVATEQSSWQHLRNAFATHRVEKVYRAIVLGAFTAEMSLLVGLRVAQHRPARVRVVEPGAASVDPSVRIATLDARPLERLGGATLVEVRPGTGFLHQIRAVLAHVGHPVVGDATYGPPNARIEAARQLLHASSIRFEEISAEAPDPADFRSRLAELRG